MPARPFSRAASSSLRPSSRGSESVVITQGCRSLDSVMAPARRWAEGPQTRLRVPGVVRAADPAARAYRSPTRQADLT